MKAKHTIPYLALIILTGIVAYSNSFHVPFLFDDLHNITENSVIRQPLQLLHDYLSPFSPNRRALGYLTFALNFRLHGGDVTGYHLFNLLIHLGNALLVYCLTLATCQTPRMAASSGLPDSRQRMIALFAALLFVAHPVQTQAVTYIVQRFTSLATFFYLLALYGYIRSQLPARPPGASRSRERWAWYLLALWAAYSAMKTKEIALTLPLMIAAYDGFFLAGGWRHRAPALTPMLALLCVIPLSTGLGHGFTTDIISTLDRHTRDLGTIPHTDYVITQMPVIATYLRLLILPVNQRLEYDYPLYRSMADPNVLLSLGLICLLAGLALYLYRAAARGKPEFRLISFGILWFFLALSVESGIVTLGDVIFEHRLYLPSIGLFLATAAAVNFFGRNQRTISVASVIVVVLLTLASWNRNRVWQDEITFWQDNLRKAPDKARLLASLARAYASRNLPEKGVEYYSRSLARDGGNAVIFSNRGLLYARLKRYDSALRDYNAAIMLDARLAAAYVNRGSLMMDLGRYNEALGDFTTALTLTPADAEIYNNRGNAYDYLGRQQEAIADYDRALQLNTDLAAVRYNRDLVLKNLQQKKTAGD